MSFDPLCWALNEPLAKTQYNVLTFDGDATNMEKFDVLNVVRISNEVLDFSTIARVTVTYDDAHNQKLNFTKDEILIVEEDIYTFMCPVSNEEQIIVIGLSEDDAEMGLTKGVYAVLLDEFYVSAITTETIVPIDPKYLPEEVKPKVIDLAKYSGLRDGFEDKTFDAALMTLMANGGGTMTLTGGNIADFWRDINPDRPIKTKIDWGSVVVCSQAVTVATHKGNCTQLASSLTMYDPSMGGLFTVSYAINITGESDAILCVKLA